MTSSGSSAPTLTGRTVSLTPIAEADADTLRAIRATPEVAAWWDEPESDFPIGDDPEATRFTIRHAGEIVGLIQYGEEKEPKYRSAWIDVFVAPHVHGRGIGSEAIRLLVEHLQRDRGHHRITIDPAAANAPAVACYRKAGFEEVGIMRLAERDADGRGWHDVLLMELVVEPFRCGWSSGSIAT